MKIMREKCKGVFFCLAFGVPTCPATSPPVELGDDVAAICDRYEEFLAKK